MMAFHEISPGDPVHGAAFQLVQLLSEASGDFLRTWHDPAEARSILGAAAAILAGFQFGYLLADGMLTGEQLEQARRMAVSNFNEGVQAGAETAATRQGKGGVQ